MVATLVALAVAGALMVLVVRFASENPEKANLGSPVLRFDAERLAREVEERGPALYKDPLTSRPGREIYVQHLGDDPEQGWLAIRAYASPVPTLECLLRWDGAGRRFVDPCSQRTYPPDGQGLTTYPATVADGRVSVDLRSPRP